MVKPRQTLASQVLFSYTHLLSGFAPVMGTPGLLRKSRRWSMGMIRAFFCCPLYTFLQTPVPINDQAVSK